MSVKQRLDVADPADIPPFLAKKMDYGFQGRRLKNSTDIFTFNNLKMFIPGKYLSYNIRY